MILPSLNDPIEDAVGTKRSKKNAKGLLAASEVNGDSHSGHECALVTIGSLIASGRHAYERSRRDDIVDPNEKSVDTESTHILPDAEHAKESSEEHDALHTPAGLKEWEKHGDVSNEEASNLSGEAAP